MRSRWVVALLVILTVGVWNSCISANNSTTTGTGFMWVATQGDQMVRSYTINSSSGAVSQVGNAAPSGRTPLAMAITPKGDALFVVNNGDNAIGTYTVNSDGSLTAATSQANCATCQNPVALAIDPTGAFLFIANEGTAADVTSGSVSAYTISGASLTPVAGSPFSTNGGMDTLGTGPSGLAVAGNYLYVANQFTNDISIFSFDTTGSLTLKTTCGASPSCIPPLVPRVLAGSNPSGLAFSRTVSSSNRDNYLFVADTGSNQVSVFMACVAVSISCGSPTGVLTAVSGSPFGAGNGPVEMVVDPAADFVYAVDKTSFQVSEYSMSPATGVLSAMSPAAASVGASPISAGITSDGLWFFVANNGASNLSAFGVGAGGHLNPAGTASIALPNQPSAIAVR
jgi:6-phosphogluconolactonase